jgi:hypothetical protein
MIHFSLKELCYWWTVWMVYVVGVATYYGAKFVVVVATPWFLGTVVVGWIFGRRIGWTYSVIFGFLLILTLFATVKIDTVPPTRFSLDHIIGVSTKNALINGTLVWAIAFSADWVFMRYVRAKLDSAGN